MHLPELEKGWRWKIVPSYQDSWEAVAVRLQKKHWFSGWMTVRSQVASTIVVGSNLEEEVAKTAANIWDIQFGDSPSNRISGVYYGDNQHREK